jgi:STE24 endopeptidase
MQRPLHAVRFRGLPRAPALARDDTPLSEPSAAPPSPPEPAQLDSERQRQAKRYARQRQVLALVGLIPPALVVIVLLLTPLAFALRDALAGATIWQPVAGWYPVQIAAYALIVVAVITLLSLPLTYYRSFVLPHHYGLSTQTRHGWISDALKEQALSLPLELAAVEVVYLLLAVTPDTWWVWVAILTLLFSALLTNLLPVLVLPLFYKLTPLPEGEIRQTAMELAARARTRVRGIYSMNMSKRTTAANAMVIGLGNTRRIVLGDTLLSQYTPDEIEVVVAHELGHQVHHDIPKLILVESATTLVGLYLVNVVVHAVVARVPGYTGLADVATLPLLALVFGIFGLLMLPITNGFSRWVEHRADVYALQSTRKPGAFISAMNRLANQNLAESDPSPVVEFLLYSHPSIGRRLAYARRVGATWGTAGEDRAAPQAAS